MVDKKAKKYVINQSNNQYFVGNNTSEITNWRYYMPAKYNITKDAKISILHEVNQKQKALLPFQIEISKIINGELNWKA